MRIGRTLRQAVLLVVTGGAVACMLAFIWGFVPIAQAQAMTDYGRLAFPGLDVMLAFGSWLLFGGATTLVASLIAMALGKILKLD